MLLDVDHLVGAHEIGRMLGLSRQRVNQLAATPDFPKPDVVLAMGKVWKTDQIREWAAAHKRDVAEDES